MKPLFELTLKIITKEIEVSAITFHTRFMLDSITRGKVLLLLRFYTVYFTVYNIYYIIYAI